MATYNKQDITNFRRMTSSCRCRSRTIIATAASHSGVDHRNSNHRAKQPSREKEVLRSRRLRSVVIVVRTCSQMRDLRKICLGKRAVAHSAHVRSMQLRRNLAPDKRFDRAFIVQNSFCELQGREMCAYTACCAMIRRAHVSFARIHPASWHLLRQCWKDFTSPV
jgi:hypothetical protein